ncbi:hypothetical protein HGB07_03530 [Candidatus Roizmanbacteria bacterium]|nr:hypothetical protein [Candidatus Roizmanbacteria bacterium]
MNTIKKQNLPLFLLLVFGVSLLIIFLGAKFVSHLTKSSMKTESIAVKQVDQQIMSDGTVRSQNEASLHFQTGGR